QKRIRYNPLETSIDPVTQLVINGKLEISGLLNDKAIGDPTLTADPPAVYVLEPNILTATERDALQALDNSTGSAWDTAVQALYDLTRNPNGITGTSGAYVAGLDGQIKRDPITGLPLKDAGGNIEKDLSTPAPNRAFGPGLALLPNAGFLDPKGV